LVGPSALSARVLAVLEQPVRTSAVVAATAARPRNLVSIFDKVISSVGW
jgi:hypothetical protein